MIYSQQEYIDLIAKRAANSRKILAQTLKQRRNQVVDLHGIEYERSVTVDTSDPNAGDSTPVAYIAIAVSPDLIYWERFEFKITIYNAHSGVKNVRIAIDGVDVSPYFAAQHDSWIDKAGIFPSDDVNKNYDVLQAASLMKADGEDDLANQILKPGYKLVTVSADTPFRMMLTVMHLKYSHMNR